MWPASAPAATAVAPASTMAAAFGMARTTRAFGSARSMVAVDTPAAIDTTSAEGRSADTIEASARSIT